MEQLARDVLQVLRAESEEVGQGRKVINHLNIPQLKSALVKGFGLD